MMIKRNTVCCLVGWVLFGQCLSASVAQTIPATAPETSISFTAAQATQGKLAYTKHCAACHGDDLAGIHLAPSLVRERFDRNWRGKSIDVLAFHLRRMPMKPLGSPGSLSDDSYTNILAFLLAANNFSPGETPLPAAPQAQARISIPRLAGVDYDPDRPVTLSSAQQQLLANRPPVTNQMLHEPAADDWLYWGRTDDGQNYSPLRQINKQNVHDLRLAWRAPLRQGASMPTPLVYHGIMYLNTFPDTVLAIDASNGEMLWRYQRNLESAISTKKMGLGLHGDLVLVPTSDLHVIALHAKTGRLIWDHTIATDTAPAMRGRYQLRSAPLVVGNRLIQGVTASGAPRGGFILAIDLDRGQEVWRFNTIARPGEPGGNSWNGLGLDQRSGGSVWHQGTYDKELNLVYFGVAPTYDTGPLLHAVDRPGVTNDALYTNCTLALNPDTGELAWYYQHMPNDQWDLDWAFERQIVKLKVDGEDRKVVINVGKMAILEALDAATGQYLFSIDAGIQNVITAIDKQTGRKSFNPEVAPNPDRPCVVCPSAFGARSWPATSFSPQTRLVYVPITNWCMKMGREGLKILTSGVGLVAAPPPGRSDGHVGRLQAYDIDNRQLAWSFDHVAPPTTSLLSTAGGLVFGGDLEPSIKAFDDTSGKMLWRASLDDHPSSSIVTYRVGQQQFVAVVVGQTNNHVRDLQRTYDAARSGSGQPSIAAAGGGAAIWTFALDTVVREWTVDELAPALPEVNQGRSLVNGQRIFTSASCQACHKLHDQKIKIAPSLTAIRQKLRSGRIDRLGLLTEILQPSNTIDKPFRTQVIATDTGVLVSGIVVFEDDDLVRLLSNPLEAGVQPKQVTKSSIDQRTESEVSLMPLGLVNGLSRADILDLLAYIERGEAQSAPDGGQD